MPTFVTAHTFCASRDTRVSYEWCVPTYTGIFLRGLNYAKKSEFGKCFWYPNRKLGVTLHVSEIIKFNLENNAIYFFPGGHGNESCNMIGS